MPQRIRRIVSLFGPLPHLRRLLSPILSDDRQYLAYMAAGGDECMPGSPWLRLRSVREANEAYLISYWRKVFACLPEDPTEFAPARRALAELGTRYSATGTLRTQGVYIHETAGYVDSLAQGEVRRRVALSAADVLERWQRDGYLPIVPPVPRRDPFGMNLRYLPTAQGFTIYSLGGDRQDDGGRTDAVGHDEKGGKVTTDIAWRFPLPKRDSATILAAKR